MSVQTYNEIITMPLDKIFKNIKYRTYFYISIIAPRYKIETNKSQ
jgi:hypothetical protein